MDQRIIALSITEKQKEQLWNYLLLLEKWNKAFNLTAIRNIDDMVVKHILDSLSIQDFLQGEQIIDVGTGAGLPGIPLAIVFPEKQFTLLDSNGKKTRFIQQSVHDLGLSNVTVVQARVEAYQPAGQYDCILTRAFAELAQLLTLTQHLAHRETVWLAMKASSAGDIQACPGFITENHPLTVPGLTVPHCLLRCRQQQA